MSFPASFLSQQGLSILSHHPPHVPATYCLSLTQIRHSISLSISEHLNVGTTLYREKLETTEMSVIVTDKLLTVSMTEAATAMGRMFKSIRDIEGVHRSSTN